MADAILSQVRLKELFNYDGATGLLTRRIPVRGYSTGSAVGSSNGRGYVRVTVDGVRYLAHRLVWMYEYGEWPNGEIDHINRVGSDNRLSNLRVATRSQNLLNRVSPNERLGFERGISWDKHRNKWVSQKRVNKVQFNLGRFDSYSDAKSAHDKFVHDHVDNFSPPRQ